MAGIAPEAAPLKTMNCEWIEEQLSAYHDHQLDEKATAQVTRHLETCAHCRAVLKDYAHFHQLVSALPREEPRPQLRARIFSSPEFREIIQERQTLSPSRTRMPSRPLPVLPAARNPVLVTRALIGVAIVMLLLASAGAVLRSLAAQSTVPSCAAPTQGPHLLTRQGAGPLASDGQNYICHIDLGGSTLWQTSSDGRMLAYVDTNDGDVHIAASDGSGERVVSDLRAKTTGQTVSNLAWSPDDQSLAFLVHVADVAGLAHYRVMVTPADHRAVSILDDINTTAIQGSLRWSMDSQALAYAYNAATQTATTQVRIARLDQTVGATAVISGSVAAVQWSKTGLTFAIVRDGAFIAIQKLPLKGGTTPHAYIPEQGITLTAVAFNAGSDQWAIARSDGTIVTLDAATLSVTPLARLGNVTALTWEAAGRHLVALSGTALWLIGPDGPTRLTANSGTANPAWQPNGTTVAFVDAGIVTLAVPNGQSHALNLDPGTIKGLFWSPDGERLAIWDTNHVIVVDPTGMTIRTLSPSPETAPVWIITP